MAFLLGYLKLKIRSLLAISILRFDHICKVLKAKLFNKFYMFCKVLEKVLLMGEDDGHCLI